MRHRGLLHPNRVPAFVEWANAHGYDQEEAKGDYEVLRLRARDRGRRAPPMSFYQRTRTDHLTAFDAGLQLVRRFLRECPNPRKRRNP